MARFNASLQIGYLLLAARAHGLATGPMAGFDADAVTEEFFPGGRHRALLVVNLGHPARTPGTRGCRASRPSRSSTSPERARPDGRHRAAVIEVCAAAGCGCSRAAGR